MDMDASAMHSSAGKFRECHYFSPFIQRHLRMFTNATPQFR
jgi:hypothetical protein